LTKAIRAVYSGAELPVLMLSDSIYPASAYKIFSSGANDYLKRPFDAIELKSRVKQLLKTKQTSKTAINMELAFLQAQIKPHFICNTLNTILYLTYENMDEAKELIMNLSVYLRGGFDFSNTENYVPIEKEFELVKAYLKIEKVRYREKLTVIYKNNEKISYKIPPLLIQTIVENAVIHGILPKKDGGTLEMSVVTDSEYCIIKIKDDGIGMSETKINEILSENHSSNGVGIKNVRKRLNHIAKSELVINSVENSGTEVIVKIPKIL